MALSGTHTRNRHHHPYLQPQPEPLCHPDIRTVTIIPRTILHHSLCYAACNRVAAWCYMSYTGVVLTGAPSRVICMRNMVGPRQVDEELEEEVRGPGGLRGFVGWRFRGGKLTNELTRCTVDTRQAIWGVRCWCSIG